MQIDKVDRQVESRDVSQELAQIVQPAGRARVGDGRRTNLHTPTRKGLHEALVPAQHAREVHARRLAREARVGFVETKDGVAAVVGDAVIDVTRPDRRERRGVVVEKRDIPKSCAWV